MLNVKIAYVSDHHNLKKVQEDIAKSSLIGGDTETTSLDPITGKIRLISLATSEATWVLDMFQLPKKAVWEMVMEPLLTDPNKVKIFQNWKFDAKFIQTCFGKGLYEARSVFDTLLAYKLLDGGQNSPAGLDSIASKLLGMHLDKSYQKFDWSGNLYKEPIAYAGLDAAIMLPLYRILSKSLAENKLLKVAKIEFDCIPAIAQMELNGVLIDKEKWLHSAEKIKEDMYNAEVLLREYFGDINLGSTQQLCKVLSEMTGMDIKSSAKSSLEDLIKGYYEKPDLFGKVMDYRLPIMRLQEYNEMKSTHTRFGPDFLKHVHKVTGRVHSNFTQLGPNTGRLSSSEPNLQNIKRDSDIRGSFIAAPGHQLWRADYSQFELRILANFSRDEAYVNAFENNIDVHSVTAQGLFHCELGAEDGEQRVLAKICNFSIPYGTGSAAYAAQAKIEIDEAKKVIKDYYKSHPGLTDWHNRTFDYFRMFNCVRTAAGRIRALPHWRYDEYAAMQAAKNMPIQGTNADTIKVAMARCYRDLPSDTRLVLSVHDELVHEIPDKDVKEIGPEIDRIMRESAEEFVPDIPIKVDGSSAPYWSKG